MKTSTRFFFASSLAILLTACAQPPQVQTAAPPSHFERTKNSVEQYTSDALITSKIKAKYLKDISLKSAGVSVSTHHGIVTLIGALPNQAEKDRAIAIAQDTQGVKYVDATDLANTIKAMSLQPSPAKTSNHLKKKHRSPYQNARLSTPSGKSAAT